MSHYKLIAGNWKMNGNIKLIEEFEKKFSNIKLLQNIEVLICPSFPYLGQAFEAFKSLGIKVGAQDCHHKANGANTGDVSSKMIRELGSSYIIIGHSERRNNYQSEDLHIFEKVKRAIEENLIPIICIGENLAERQNDDTEEVLGNQLNFFLKNDLKDVMLRDRHGVLQTYYAMPIEATNFEVRGDGQLPRPTLTIANPQGVITDAIKRRSDLVGNTIIRKRILLL